MKKGSVITVLSNYGTSGSSYTLSLTGSGLSSGTKLTELYTCTSITVDSSGNIPVPMASGLPRALILSASATGLCGSAVSTTTTNVATTTSTSTTTGTGSCTQATALPVLFKELVTTNYGQNVYISGSISQLGSWDTSSAVALSASSYTSSNPLWQVTITLPVGTTFQYKFVEKTSGSTSVTWESDPNRSYTVPTGCTGATATVSATWR
jgi:alpha-amylase